MLCFSKKQTFHIFHVAHKKESRNYNPTQTVELLAIGYENCNILILKVSLPRYFKKNHFSLFQFLCFCGSLDKALAVYFAFVFDLS